MPRTRVILLDSRLSQVEELVLPEEAQGLEYDCSDDGEQLCYVDDTGLWLLRTEDTEPILLAAHPSQPKGEPGDPVWRIGGLSSRAARC
ncbi:MAG: hypothetical protein V8Q30_12910 [Acutalibacteraceae bacterium]